MITLSTTHTIEAKPARETGFVHVTLGSHTYLIPHAVAFTLADRIADSLTQQKGGHK